MSMRLSGSQTELRPCVQPPNAGGVLFGSHASLNSNSSLNDRAPGLPNTTTVTNNSNVYGNKGFPRFSDAVRLSQSKDLLHIKNDDSQTSNADDEETYQTVTNRRYHKRKRVENGLVNNSVPSETPAKPAGQRRPAPLLIGKGGSMSNVLKAARSIVHKKVFYVGNLAVGCTETHIKNLLEQSNIAVKTINKLGKDKDKDGVEDKNEDKDATVAKVKEFVPWYSSFRVCIEAKDEARFLNDSIWPDDIVIRNWSFKPKQNNAKKTKHSDPTMSPRDGSISNERSVSNDAHAMDYVVEENVDNDLQANCGLSVAAEVHLAPLLPSTSWGDTDILIDNNSSTKNGSQ